jgi:hypothetical protein
MILMLLKEIILLKISSERKYCKYFIKKEVKQTLNWETMLFPKDKNTNDEIKM